MNNKQIHVKNHYVPKEYLRLWTSPDGHLQVYRILVSNAKVRPWKECSPAGVAFTEHLYTKTIAGKETDEFERWLDREYEAPVHDILKKIASEDRLSPDDWEKLVRFVAAQDVRTPAHFIEDMKRWNNTVPNSVQQALSSIASKLEKGNYSFNKPASSTVNTEELPLNVTIKYEPGEETGTIEASMLTGRRLWLWEIKRVLEHTSKILHQHKWTILKPPKGMIWFTSDNPVIRLNFHGDDKYDFGGGWGSPRSDIILPLSPQYLLYTQIGKRPTFNRYERIPVSLAERIRRMIAEHAHRMIISKECDPVIPLLRPRVVDADLYHWEHNQWALWHKTQTEAEQEFDIKKEILTAHKETDIT